MREQSIAVGIEHLSLRYFELDLKEASCSLGGILSASEVRQNLMHSLAIFLCRYYKTGDFEYDKKVDNFLDEYSFYYNKSIDDIGEDLSEKIIDEFEEILKNKK